MKREIKLVKIIMIFKKVGRQIFFFIISLFQSSEIQPITICLISKNSICHIFVQFQKFDQSTFFDVQD